MANRFKHHLWILSKRSPLLMKRLFHFDRLDTVSAEAVQNPSPPPIDRDPLSRLPAGFFLAYHRRLASAFSRARRPLGVVKIMASNRERIIRELENAADEIARVPLSELQILLRHAAKLLRQEDRPRDDEAGHSFDRFP